MKNEACAVLFSGGTDSTAAAALCAMEFKHVHLLTFHEEATKNSPIPEENVNRLRKHYPEVNFVHTVISTDHWVKDLSYSRYWSNLFRFGFYNLCTPGLSSLSWHIGAIKYAKANNIRNVFDGMTRELMHLPGHMPEVRTLFSKLYERVGMTFSSPVIDWQVPEDQRYIDRLIVDRHGFVAAPELNKKPRTTGQWLYEQGIFPHPNVKGSLFDQRMQHDCYPFVVFNIFVFWWAEPRFGKEGHRQRMLTFFESKIEHASRILDIQ